MKRVITAVLLLALIVCAASVQAKSVQLAYKYTAGQIDNYKLVMDMKMKMPGMPGASDQPMNMQMVMLWSQKVLGILPDGSAKIKVTYKDMNMKMPGMAPGTLPKTEIPKDVSVTMVMGRDGKVIKMEGMEKLTGAPSLPGMDMNQMMNQMGMYGMSWLPKGPIEVGQSWDNSMPLFGDAGELKTTSKLEAAAVPVGKATAAKIRQNINGSFDLGKMMSALAGTTGSAGGQGADAMKSMFAQMTGTLSMSGNTVTYFSPQKGKMLKAGGLVSAIMKMTMPAEATAQGAPSTLNMNMDMNINIYKLP